MVSGLSNSEPRLLAATADPFIGQSVARNDDFQTVHPELQAMMDGLSELVLLASCDGTILAANHHWLRTVELREAWAFGVGGNYPEAVAGLIAAGDMRA